MSKTTTTAQAIEALRRLLIDLESGRAAVTTFSIGVVTTPTPPYTPTGQETISVTIERKG